MTAEQVIAYFGTKASACKAIGINPNNFTYWARMGYIPQLAQIKLEKVSNGDLKADVEPTATLADTKMITMNHCRENLDKFVAELSSLSKKHGVKLIHSESSILMAWVSPNQMSRLNMIYSFETCPDENSNMLGILYSMQPNKKEKLNDN